MILNTYNLFPHQLEGQAFCNKHDNPALFMDPRLGKVRTIVSAVVDIYDCQRVLISCPYSAIYGWISEIHACGESVFCPAAYTKKEDRRNGLIEFLNSGYRFCIVNHQFYMGVPELAQCPFDMVIEDESHSIKNPKADITKYYLKNFRDIRKAILSGTPALNHPLDYYSQFKFLHEKPFGFGNFYTFRDALFYKAGFIYKPRAGTLDRITDYISENAFVKRKQDIDVKLSEQTHMIRNIKMCDDARRLYKKIKLEYRSEETSTIFTCAVYGWLRSMGGGWSPEGKLVCDKKNNELWELLEGEYKNERVVVFFSGDDEISANLKKSYDLAHEVHTIRGSDTLETRRQSVEWFNKTEDAKLFVQCMVGDAGLDLSASDTVIFFTLPDNPTKYVQCCERTVNLKKHRNLLYIYLCYEDSLDMLKYETLIGKKERSQAILGESVRKYLEYDNV